MSLQSEREHLIDRMREAVVERRYKAQAEIGVQLRAVTLRQLQAELAAERKLYRSLRRRGGSRQNVDCRERAKLIAAKIQQRQLEEA